MSEQMLLLEIVDGDGFKSYVREHDLAGVLEKEIQKLEIGGKISIEKTDMTEEQFDNNWAEIENY